MSQRFKPITMGSPEFVEMDVTGFHVTDARFTPTLVLPPHEHEHATIAVMLEGSFDLNIGGRTLSCEPDTLFTEPPGERHSNRIERGGAHVLVVQPRPECTETLQPHESVIHALHHLPHSPVSRFARRISRELRAPDASTPLAVEGLILEMLASLTRVVEVSRRESSRPRWLHQAEELLRASFLEPMRVSEVASQVGVHPVHLTRVFRAHYGVSLATYVRHLRLDWAAEQLLSTTASLSSIAYRAGFADQSHFTRAFKAYTSLTPNRYRAARRPH